MQSKTRKTVYTGTNYRLKNCERGIATRFDRAQGSHQAKKNCADLQKVR